MEIRESPIALWAEPSDWAIRRSFDIRLSTILEITLRHGPCRTKTVWELH